MAVLCGCGHVVSTALMCSVCNCPAPGRSVCFEISCRPLLEESAHLLFKGNVSMSLKYGLWYIVW
jgi:hypothetical protein